MMRQLSKLDELLDTTENALRTLLGETPPRRPSPAAAHTAADKPSNAMTEKERKTSIRLMRVNHTGEVCAQALYQGQALTAKLPNVRQEMNTAAEEEQDHLNWCQERIDDLGGKTSLFNPAFYALSFGLGATAGMISDRVSLGFVAATEEGVCEHLRQHQLRLPESDAKSHAVVAQMIDDETRHGQHAREAGGIDFPLCVKAGMRLVSKTMTATAERI